jgi:tRNA N6-adenosine threonylcarbamoyltransferase
VKVLGLESSCDETAAAVVEDGRRILADVVSSQVAVHATYGGVVPELASRHHVVNVLPVVTEALARAGLSLDAIDAVAVTRGPGLVGALLVAMQLGKTIAYARGLPLIGVHHLEGHLSAVYLDEAEAPAMPHGALLVSGGHTAVIHVMGHGRYLQLGRTRDDAAGEAFDKVAKLLGLGYPGGATIERLARGGDPLALKLPRPMPRKEELDFSFSGLKTWVLNWVREHGVPAGQALADLCASFQHAVVLSLVSKTREAVRRMGATEVQLAGGVAANGALRAALRAAGEEDGFRLFVPPPRHCTDNAAMIAAAGFFRLVRGERAGLDLNADANLPLPAP